MLYKLESLRGIAALCVIFYHSYFNYSETKLSFFSNSYLFVDFFFILSGFVMALAYQARIKQGLGFLKFFCLRLGRLYPLHFVMLFVWVAYIFSKHIIFTSFGLGSAQFYEGSPNNLFTFLSHFFLVNGMWTIDDFVWNAPSWSISVEFFAYLIFYAYALCALSSKNIYIPLVISLITYFLIYDSFDLTLQGGLIRCIAGFYLGVFIFNIRHVCEPLFSNYRTLKELMVFVGLIVTITYADSLAFQTVSLVLMGMCILLFSSNNHGAIGSLLESKYVTNIGKWSFSIYMTHTFIISIHEVILDTFFGINSFNTFGVSSLLINASMVVFTVFTSMLTYKYIEVYFREKVRGFVSMKH